MHEAAWFRWARVVVLPLLGLFAVMPVYVMLSASLKPLSDVPACKVATQRVVFVLRRQ